MSIMKMSVVLSAVIVTAATVGLGAPAIAGDYEKQVAIECAALAKGNPKATAACTASRLTKTEINKCSNGIGSQDGCFGPNNTVRKILTNPVDAIKKIKIKF